MLNRTLNSVYNAYRQQHSMASKKVYDMAIVGGGIVGLGTARALQLKYPDMSIVLLEKEKHLAIHQTGHNSGVIHMGIYYTPGSLKAKLCVEGALRTYDYCDERAIPYRKCGKLIVATSEAELDRLDVLYDKGLQNKVPGLAMVDQDMIQQLEPACTGGIKAIHSPNTGIVDWKSVARAYGADFEDAGGTIICDVEVKKIKDFGKEIRIKGKKEEYVTKNVITCAGLYADRVAVSSGGEKNPAIVPFRGEYLKLTADKQHLVNGNIYPVPNPNFPFLGVHFTPRMDGSIWVGPNAVLATAREGYSGTDFNLKDMVEMASLSGLWTLATKNISFGIQEMSKSMVPALQLQHLQRFIPELLLADLVAGPAGVRAQAVAPDGSMVDDFTFDESCHGMLHVRNAPSPAATSSLAIADKVVDKATQLFKL